MSYVELCLIGLSLCFDTFAVSLTGGICMKVKPNKWQTIKIFMTFALFQMGLTLLGWLLGTGFYIYIERIDHWIAFGLLAYIGGSMVLEGMHGKDDVSCEDCAKSRTDLLDPKKLCLLAVATSIDALAVGACMALGNIGGPNLNLPVAVCIIGSITFAAALLSFHSARLLHHLPTRWLETTAGLLLITLGIKLMERRLAKSDRRN